jgi:broad specificity phosphatase PhoE
MKLNNKYYILRHGEAKSNIGRVVSCWPEKFENHLTEAGVEKIKNVAEELKNKNIELIFTSPLLRAEETAGIVAKNFSIKPKKDKRLRELGFGKLNGKSEEEFTKYFKNVEERLKRRSPNGENFADVLKRVWVFFKEINKKYKGKNILIVSHQVPLLLLLGKLNGHSIMDSLGAISHIPGEKRITRGELIEVN